MGIEPKRYNEQLQRLVAAASALMLLALAAPQLDAADGKCLTRMPEGASVAFDNYVKDAELASLRRFQLSQLGATPAENQRDSALLAKGLVVAHDLNPVNGNTRLAPVAGGEIQHWIGAVRLPGCSIDSLRSVVTDYPEYGRVYQPYVSRAAPATCGVSGWFISIKPGSESCVTLFLRDRVLGIHYDFRVSFVIDASSSGDAFQMTSRAVHIQEVDEEGPNAKPFADGMDHGILWRLNTYWRARKADDGLYVQYEIISLARSVDDFWCFGGLFDSISRRVMRHQMDSIPADTLRKTMENTKRELERRSALAKKPAVRAK